MVQYNVESMWNLMAILHIFLSFFSCSTGQILKRNVALSLIYCTKVRLTELLLFYFFRLCSSASDVRCISQILDLSLLIAIRVVILPQSDLFTTIWQVN